MAANQEISRDDLLAKLDALVLEGRTRRHDTHLIALEVNVPWQGRSWEGVEFYDVRQDLDVSDRTALPVKYMTGADIPPHVTMTIVDHHYVEKAKKITKELEKTITMLAPLICDGVEVFPQAFASKALGAKGQAVIMKLKVSEDLKFIRTAVMGCLPAPVELFQGVEAGPPDWIPHVNVGYVRTGDVENQENLKKALQQFVGKPVAIKGWFSL